jgi:hypothetical protein
MSEWPPLPLADWTDTQATLHRWTQIVGKIKLALAPPVNHWWHVTLLATARGLTTSPMPVGAGALDITFDFIDHVCRLELSDGRRRDIRLEPKSVAAFYGEMMTALHDLGATTRIWPVPVEIPGDALRFDRDEEHRSYDVELVERWWRITSAVDNVFKIFRGRFLGKSSPVHFFWGSFDLVVTRFSGRRAPDRPEADPVTREAYSHEVTSAGFWPGSGTVAEPAFYAYAAPAPAGFATAKVSPSDAFFSPEFGGLFLYKYDDMRRASSPDAALLDFLQTTYEAGATLGGWDRAALERSATP